MLVRRARGRLWGLSLGAAALAAGAAVAGAARPGLYRPFTPDHLMPGALGQDLLTLAVALGLAGTVAGIRRGAERLWLVWLGLVGYLFYAYALYAFEAIYNPVFPVYLAIAGLSLWAVLVFFAVARPDALAAGPGAPRRGTAGLFLLLAAVFAGLWLSIILPATAARIRPDGASIFVLDLVFVLPALALTGLGLLRRWPLADLLAVPLLVKAGTLGLSVLLGTLMAPSFGMPLRVGEVGLYALLGLAPLPLLAGWLRAARIRG